MGVPGEIAIVELAAPQATPELAAVLVAACSSATTSARCALAAADVAPQIVAHVTFDEPGNAAVIVVRLAREGAEAVERTLRFSNDDVEKERWKTVGFVIGSIAEGLALEPPAPPVPPPGKSPASPPLPAKPPAAGEADRPPVAIDVSAVLGSALEDGSLRAGVGVRGAYAFPGLPLLIGVSLRYATRPPDEVGLDVHWIGATFGLGTLLELGIPELAFDARIEVLSEFMLATVREPFTGASDAASRWAGGGRLSADLVYMPIPRFGIVGGVDGSLVQSGTVVKIREDRTGRVPPYSVAGTLGVRFALP